MSFNNTSFFTNYTGTLEDYNTFYYYVYIHPIVTWLAAITNFICAIVFAQKELLSSGPFFQYSLINSIFTSVGMVVLSVFCLTRCGTLCGQAYTYWSQVYELYGIIFFVNSLYIAGSLIQISISFQLYFSISSRFNHLSNISPAKVLVGIFMVSFALGFLVMFSFQISPIRYLTVSNGTAQWDNLYYIFTDPNKQFLVYVSLFAQIISNKLFLIVLIVINTLLYIELRKIINKKSQITISNINIRDNANQSLATSSNSDLRAAEIEMVNRTYNSKPVRGRNRNHDDSKKKMLIMVLWVSVIFSSSRLVFAVANLILLVDQNGIYNWWASVVNLFYGSCVYVSYFFVYINTNKIFRKKFFELFTVRKIQS